MRRCDWWDDDPPYLAYHDDERGVPVAGALTLDACRRLGNAWSG